MVYLPTTQEWLTHSSLLLQARPSTTRITTKYTPTIPADTTSRRRRRRLKRLKQAAAPQSTGALPGVEQASTNEKPGTLSSEPASPPLPTPPASLTVKTFDPVSGVCLKYRTNKAAEVGRLITSMGRLGRGMAGLLPGVDAVEEAASTTAPAKVEESGAAKSSSAGQAVVTNPGGVGGSRDVHAKGPATGGMKKKKKKGKK